MSEGLDLDEMRATYDHPAGKSVIELIDRLQQAEARVKLLESGIVSELVVTSVNSARAIGTAVSDISEALLKLGYDGLTERLEQAEQDRVKLRNRLDAMRRQRDGYRNQLRKAEQQVQNVRELHSITFYDKWARTSLEPVGHGGWCSNCGRFDGDSCPTIRALDGEQA